MSDNSGVEELEKQLESFVENTRQLGITVNDFQSNSQAVLNQKVNTLVTGLKEIDQLKRSVGGIVIPVEVFNYIDQGQNPSLYTKNTLERALAKNEQVKGKIEVYSQFRQELQSQLGLIYPDLIAEYKRVRKEE